MKVEEAFPTPAEERILALSLAVAPFKMGAGAGSVGGPSGPIVVQGGATFTGTLYDGAGGPGVPVAGSLFVGVTYIKDPADTGDVTPFGKGTYTIKLPGGTVEIRGNAERAPNPRAVGGFGFVPNGNNQLQLLGGTGIFEGISGVALVNYGGADIGGDGTDLHLDGVIEIKLFRDVQYVAKAVAVAVGVDPATGKPLSFQGSGTSSSTRSQKHADYLAGVEARGAAATALNCGLALLNQTRV